VAELARLVLADVTLDDALQQVVTIAKGALPGADEVSITLLRGDEPYTAAHTGTLALQADEMQYQRGYGPCMDAARGGIVLRIRDMRTETRWPDYTARVIGAGVLSSLSIPLPMQSQLIGALNIYSSSDHAFEGDAQQVAEEIGSYAGVAVTNAHAVHDARTTAEQLRAAMHARAVIEQAKGVVMANRRCDADTAFAVLVKASQTANRKLRDIAADVAETGVLPELPPRRGAR
jgi:GAF domain-containing protein